MQKLRRHIGSTQQQMAQTMGTRQQTISEWERGLYRPRGVSVTLLNIIAERAEFVYRAHSKENDSARPS
ncbi:MAG: helix-turn-helix domain-containing protein [Chloroflexi bacterium]|nr:helix-turn-helix domain-containing protein [Chloroflexota bacterium]